MPSGLVYCSTVLHDLSCPETYQRPRTEGSCPRPMIIGKLCKPLSEGPNEIIQKRVIVSRMFYCHSGHSHDVQEAISQSNNIGPSGSLAPLELTRVKLRTCVDNIIVSSDIGLLYCCSLGYEKPKGQSVYRSLPFDKGPIWCPYGH